MWMRWVRRGRSLGCCVKEVYVWWKRVREVWCVRLEWGNRFGGGVRGCSIRGGGGARERRGEAEEDEEKTLEEGGGVGEHRGQGFG